VGSADRTDIETTPQEPRMALALGQEAPDFSLKDQHGVVVSLRQYRGKKNVVVLFYPFAFSSVCTGELAEIRDNVADFSNVSTEILAISCDSMYVLRTYAEREGLRFPLLTDFWPHGAVARVYGNFNEQLGCARRSTFIVDREGVLRWQVSNQMPQARDITAYRKVLSDLG
jgi:mycoredoxin-dependent peroxiredoxin